jgi:hypothetical protein
MRHHVALLRTDIPEKDVISINIVDRISDLDTTLAVTSSN